jgi:autotransporter-associated beta strand protein
MFINRQFTYMCLRQDAPGVFERKRGTMLSALVVFLGILSAPLFAQPLSWSGGSGTWTEPDSVNWGSATYNIGSNVQFTGAGGTVTVTNTGVAPGNILFASSSDYTFDGGSIGGSGSVTKTNGGMVTLSAVNTYTGETVIHAGTIKLAESGRLANTASITFSGNSSLIVPTFASSVDFTNMTIDAGVSATFDVQGGGAATAYTINSLTGSGTFEFKNGGTGGAGKRITFGNMAGFTGVLQKSGELGQGFNVPSLADSSAAIRIAASSTSFQHIFRYIGTSPLLLNNRHFELASTGSLTIQNDAASAANTFSINTDLIVSAIGNKTLTLAGSNIGTNTFGGSITNGTGATISLTKSGNGTWILSGVNDYTGLTTLSGGKLVIQGQQCLPDGGTLNITSGNLQIDDRERIQVLQFSGISTNSGIWGAQGNSSAQFTDSRLLGPGLLYVGVDFPPSGTVIILR